MNRLFIIGNGFDLAHKLKTKYSDFQNYLLETYPKAFCEYAVIPEFSISPNGKELYKDDEVVGFLLKIISEAEKEGECWKNLEKALGELEFDSFLERVDYEDDKEWHQVYANEYAAYKICGATKKIKKYFSDWIKTININETELVSQ